MTTADLTRINYRFYVSYFAERGRDEKTPYTASTYTVSGPFSVFNLSFFPRRHSYGYLFVSEANANTQIRVHVAGPDANTTTFLLNPMFIPTTKIIRRHIYIYIYTYADTNVYTCVYTSVLTRGIRKV